MKTALLGFGLSSSLMLGIAISPKAQAHTLTDELPPIPPALAEYINKAETGTLPDPLDPNLTKYWVAGGRNTYLKTGADTGGQYSLFDIYVPPDVGPPLHIHTREDEWFYVIEGNSSFQMEDEATTGGPGTLIYSPRNHLHAFKNLTTSPVRMLLYYEPSGIEDFFTAVGQPVTDPYNPPSFSGEDLVTVGAEYGLIFPSAFVFAAPEFSSDTGVTIIRTGVTNQVAGVTLALSNGIEIPVSFGIGESVKTLDLSSFPNTQFLDLLLKSPTNGAYIGLLQNQAVFVNSSPIPEGSGILGLIAFGVLGVSLKLNNQVKLKILHNHSN